MLTRAKAASLFVFGGFIRKGYASKTSHKNVRFNLTPQVLSSFRDEGELFQPES